MNFFTTETGLTLCAECLADARRDDHFDKDESIYTAVRHDEVDNPTTSPCDHCEAFQWELV